VKQTPVHGGSFVIYANKAENRQSSYMEFLHHEKQIGVDVPSFYTDFSEKVKDIKTKLMAILDELKEGGGAALPDTAPQEKQILW